MRTPGGSCENPGVSVTEVDSINFSAEALPAGQYVLVEFWQENCGPCKLMATTIASLAASFESRVQVVKCRVDHDPSDPAWGKWIDSTPTMILFRDGVELLRIEGRRSFTSIKQAIENVVGGVGAMQLS